MLDWILVKTKSSVVTSPIGGVLWALLFWIANAITLARYLQPRSDVWGPSAIATSDWLIGRSVKGSNRQAVPLSIWSPGTPLDKADCCTGSYHGAPRSTGSAPRSSRQSYRPALSYC